MVSTLYSYAADMGSNPLSRILTGTSMVNLVVTITSCKKLHRLLIVQMFFHHVMKLEIIY